MRSVKSLAGAYKKKTQDKQERCKLQVLFFFNYQKLFNALSIELPKHLLLLNGNVDTRVKLLNQRLGTMKSGRNTINQKTTFWKNRYKMTLNYF